MIPPHTGWAWLDVAVCVISGVGFVGFFANLYLWYRNVMRKPLDDLNVYDNALREAGKFLHDTLRPQHPQPPESSQSEAD